MKHSNPNMLLRIGQGDALGMATEYLDLGLPEHLAAKTEALKLERYVKHPKWDIPAGHYTDDTQMSIAVARTLDLHDFALPETVAVREIRPLPGTTVHHEEGDPRSEWPGEWEKIIAIRRAFAQDFVRFYQRDRRLGYSKYFQAFLDSVHTGDEFLLRCYPHSDKNGAAMRSVPIGVLPDPKLVLHVAREQARITHDTYGGRVSSEMVALMSYFALYHDAPLSGVREFLASILHVSESDRDPLSLLSSWGGGPVAGSGVGMKTARAVMTLILEEKTLLGIAKRALEWGGDTDTVIAVSWGIASARMKEELPAWLDTGLENGDYGRDYLADLGTKLMEKYA